MAYHKSHGVAPHPAVLVAETFQQLKGVSKI